MDSDRVRIYDVLTLWPVLIINPIRKAKNSTVLAVSALVATTFATMAWGLTFPGLRQVLAQVLRHGVILPLVTAEFFEIINRAGVGAFKSLCSAIAVGAMYSYVLAPAVTKALSFLLKDFSEETLTIGFLATSIAAAGLTRIVLLFNSVSLVKEKSAAS